VLGGLLMSLAGQWRSVYLWGLTAGIMSLSLYAAAVLDPDLARERFRPPSKGADPTALAWIRVTALATFVFSTLDGGRLHWSPPVPALLRGLALVGCLAGTWFVIYAMAANRFFSSVVRVQTDRGHHVVDKGPYARIRHPGYLGMMIMCPLAALALGSWWGLLPALIYSGLMLLRVIGEDRFLLRNLDGYSQYSLRVPSRIIPGVW